MCRIITSQKEGVPSLMASIVLLLCRRIVWFSVLPPLSLPAYCKVMNCDSVFDFLTITNLEIFAD